MAGVDLRGHQHGGDAGLFIPGGDGALDGRGPAPARQQRGVDVDAAAPRQGEGGGADLDAIGADDGEVDLGRLQLALDVGVSEQVLMIQAGLLSGICDRSRRIGQAPTARARRRTGAPDELELRCTSEAQQRRDREGSAAEISYAQGRAQAVSAAAAARSAQALS